MSIKEQVKQMLSEEDDFKPEDFSNLILDTLKIEALTAEDKSFLEEFDNLELLALNDTGLKSTKNLPDSDLLIRLELKGNQLKSADLAVLKKYKDLRTLKLGENPITCLTEVIDHLKCLENLFNLELPVDLVASEKDRASVFKAFPNLEVLNKIDKDGAEYSEDEDEIDEYGSEDEEGEEDMDGSNPEQEGESEYDDEDEEGDQEENPEDDDSDELENPLGKREGDKSNGSGPSKRQK